MGKEIKYSEAINELQMILQSIENQDVDVDELTEKVKRASVLLKLCSAKLKNTEVEVSKILEELKEN